MLFQAEDELLYFCSLKKMTIEMFAAPPSCVLASTLFLLPQESLR